MKKVIDMILYTSFFALVLLSCRKTDDSPPTILILEPTGFPTYAVGETIGVTVEVSDDQQIDWLRFDLINNLNVPTGPSVTYYNVDPGLHQESAMLTLSDYDMESGQYFIRVVASDGRNEKSDFLQVTIQGIPLERLGFIIAEQNTLDFDVLRYNNNFDLEYSGSQLGFIDQLQIDSRHQRCELGRRDPTELNTFLSSDFTDVLSTTDVLGNGAVPFFLNSHHDESNHKSYFTTHTGDVYTKTASQSTANLAISTTDSYLPFSVTTNNDFIILGERNDNNTLGRVSLYHLALNTFSQSSFCNLEEPQVLSVANRILVIGNEDGQGRIQELNTSSVLIQNIDDFASFPEWESACAVSDDVLVCSSENTIYQYFLNASSVQEINNWPIGAEQMHYDPLSGSIFAINDQGLWELNGDLSTLRIPSSNIKQFGILYNR